MKTYTLRSDIGQKESIEKELIECESIANYCFTNDKAVYKAVKEIFERDVNSFSNIGMYEEEFEVILLKEASTKYALLFCGSLTNDHEQFFEECKKKIGNS